MEVTTDAGLLHLDFAGSERLCGSPRLWSIGWFKSSVKLVSNRTSGVKYFVSNTVSWSRDVPFNQVKSAQFVTISGVGRGCVRSFQGFRQNVLRRRRGRRCRLLVGLNRNFQRLFRGLDSNCTLQRSQQGVL